MQEAWEGGGGGGGLMSTWTDLPSYIYFIANNLLDVCLLSSDTTGNL